MTEPFQILFLCTGNTCRSPMGEAILRKRLEEKQIENVRVLSAGTFALDGKSASEEAAQAVQNYGASLDGFQSQTFTDALASSHLILVMERAHQDIIEEHYPYAADKVRLLGQFLYPKGPEEIPDPVGGPLVLFNETAALIDRCIVNLVRDWDAVVERYYSPQKKIVTVGVDHRAFPDKEWLISILESLGKKVIDCGTMSPESCDHPDFAFKAVDLVSWRLADRAVLICGTGHGMLLAANKVLGVRCVLPLNVEHALLSRKHNNANAIAFGADYYSRDRIEEIVRAWLDAEFLGGKYQRRIRKINNYELQNFG